jgi:hypothetical protein
MTLQIRHNLLQTWFEPVAPSEGAIHADLGILKRVLAGRGVNSRGWRLYLDYGDALFERLGRPWVAADWLYSSGHNAVAFLRLLQSCEMDVLPPPEMISSMCRWEIPKDRLSSVPPAFFRAVWKRCIASEYAGVPVAAYVEAEVVPLAKWFFRTGQHVNPEPSQLKAGWDALERLYLEWVRTHPAQLVNPRKLSCAP